MKILSLDTATEACSAALFIDGEVIESYQVAPRRHATLIMPMIKMVMAEAGLAAAQLDALAFGRGPGSFTGVRIAVGIVQGLAFAANLPVMPISTLAAIARGAMFEHGVSQVAAAIDARMQEVYWGAYRAVPDGGVVLIDRERVCSPSLVTLADNGEWFGAGSGWAVYTRTLQHSLAVRCWWGDHYPRARDIALLGAQAYRRGEFVTVDRVIPVYLRDEVAQKVLPKRRK